MNITVRNIWRTYGETIALHDCSISFQNGLFSAVIGPNGSGKSTLLRIVSLLEEPDRGEVLYQENDSVEKHNDSLKKQRAVVLPGESLFHDSVFNNIAYGLRIRNEQKGIVRDKVHAILEKFRLSGKVRNSVLTLSSGEAQRVAVARALVIEPRYLFLDEPTASLDPDSTEIIETALRESAQRNGMTTILITHSMFQAQRIADRVIFLYKGKVIEDSPKERIFENPEHELTLRFLSGRLVW